jgi:hypothetical protein
MPINSMTGLEYYFDLVSDSADLSKYCNKYSLQSFAEILAAEELFPFISELDKNVLALYVMVRSLVSSLRKRIVEFACVTLAWPARQACIIVPTNLFSIPSFFFSLEFLYDSTIQVV